MAARKKPTRFQRTQVVVRAHPWVTWGVLASIVAVLGGIVPGVLWVIERFQTVDAAKMHSARAEKPACDQYRQEFDEQTQRAHDLYNQAMKIGKQE